MKFALLTASRYFPEAQLERVAAAGRIRGPQIAALWTPLIRECVALDLRCVSSVNELVDDDIPIVGTETIDEPNDLAYHYEKDGRPYGIVLCGPGQSLASMLRAWAHERDEIQGDALCDQYVNVTLPDGSVARIARELKDPCQEDSDLVTLPDGSTIDEGPVATPAWFGMGLILPGTPTLSNGAPCVSGTCRPGGYYGTDSGSQVFGMGYVEPSHKWHHHSRQSRRKRKQAQVSLR